MTEAGVGPSVGVVDVSKGQGVTIVSPSNVYGCKLDDDVFVGPFVEIQTGAAVGARTKVQSHSFICEMVTIGEDCVIGHGVMFTNDRFRGGPARGDKARWEATTIGDRVYIGSGTTLLPVSICHDVVIGAGAVVVQDIDVPGTYAGNPCRRIS